MASRDLQTTRKAPAASWVPSGKVYWTPLVKAHPEMSMVSAPGLWISTNSTASPRGEWYMISVSTTPAGDPPKVGPAPWRKTHAIARRAQRGLKERHLIQVPYSWTLKTRRTLATIDPSRSRVKESGATPEKSKV